MKSLLCICLTARLRESKHPRILMFKFSGVVILSKSNFGLVFYILLWEKMFAYYLPHCTLWKILQSDLRNATKREMKSSCNVGGSFYSWKSLCDVGGKVVFLICEHIVLSVATCYSFCKFRNDRLLVYFVHNYVGYFIFICRKGCTLCIS